MRLLCCFFVCISFFASATEVPSINGFYIISLNYENGSSSFMVKGDDLLMDGELVYMTTSMRSFSFDDEGDSIWIEIKSRESYNCKTMIKKVYWLKTLNNKNKIIDSFAFDDGESFAISDHDRHFNFACVIASKTPGKQDAVLSMIHKNMLRYMDVRTLRLNELFYISGGKYIKNNLGEYMEDIQNDSFIELKVPIGNLNN